MYLDLLFSSCCDFVSCLVPQVQMRVPNRVRMIQREAFLDCSSLTHVTLSFAFARIEATAFAGCRALESAAWCRCSTHTAMVVDTEHEWVATLNP